MFCSLSTFGQNEVAKMVIAIANEKDTLSVEHFDALGNLVFEKHYTTYGIAMIRAFSYNDNNRETKFIWLHSNAGFIITDYEYDSIQNTRKEFRYESKSHFDNGLSFVLEMNNIKDLEESTRFKELIERGGHISKVSYFTDTLPIKDISFDKNGDTSKITSYFYDQNLLILQHDTSAFFSCRLFYTYDTLGRMLSWGKCDKDNPSILYEYNYEIPNIIKICELEGGKNISTEIEEYKNNAVVKRSFYRKSNNEKPYRVISYEYDEENRLINEFDSNYLNAGKSVTIKYIYITK